MWSAVENIGSWNLNTYKWLLKNRHSPWKNTYARAHIWTRTRIQRKMRNFLKVKRYEKLGGRGAIFARGKFKCKLFLNELQYEPETSWLFLSLTRDQKKKKFFLKKILSFQGVTYLFSGDIAKKKTVRICRNSFSRRNKYVHY